MQRRAFDYVQFANRAKTALCYPMGRCVKPQNSGHGPAALREGMIAGALAGLLSGAPSTVHALLTGRDPLAAARAAGNLLRPADAGPGALLLAGGIVHVAVSLGWGTVLAMAVRRTSVRSLAAHAAPVGGTPPIPRAVAVGAAIAGAFLGGSRRRCRGDTPHPPGLRRRG